MKSFPCCPYKKRDESGIDEGTSIYLILRAPEEKQQSVIVLGCLKYCRMGWRNYGIFRELMV